MASAAMKASARRSLRARDGKRAGSGLRPILVAVCAAYYVQKCSKPYWLPHGPAVTQTETFRYAPVDHSNDLLRLKHGRTKKIYANNGDLMMKGPETVVFGNDGSMYVLTEDAKLVQLKDVVEGKGDIWNATARFVADLGVGRPLGGRFVPNGGDTLYIGDAVLGLTRLAHVQDPTCKLEIVASSVVDQGVRTPILYADDVAVGPKTGRVYFTDASDIPADRLVDHRWDTLHASKLDLVRGKGTGRLLQYDPATDEVTVLARDLKFANGIGVDKEETYLMVAESFGVTLLQYNLQEGTLQVAVASKDLPGYLDGVDCSWTTGKCYAVIPSAVAPLHKILSKFPAKLGQISYTLVMMLPRPWVPPPKRFGGIVEVDPLTHAVRFLLDPTGQDIAMLTGVTEHNHKLYLGSLQNDYIGVYNLE